MKTESQIAQSCPTLWPHGLQLPGSSVYGIFQERVLEWGAITFSDAKLNLVNYWSCTALSSWQLHLPFLSPFSSVQLLSRVRLFGTPWTAARQASLSITNSQSLPKIMSIESVMPSNHLILCCPLLLPSIFPSIRVFSNESALHIRWPKYWSFSFNISPSNDHPGLIFFRMDWLDLLAVQGLSSVFSKTAVQKHQFCAQLSL